MIVESSGPEGRLGLSTRDGGKVALMGRPAARNGDPHTCPLTAPTPHVGGPITMGWPTVQVGGQDAATVACLCTCAGPPDVIAVGSPTVLILGLDAARQTDMTAHGGLISAGFA